MVLVIAMFVTGHPQAQILAWETAGLNGDEASFAATTKHAGLASSSITRGAGIVGSAAADMFNSRSFNGASSAAGTRAQAIADNEYFQFTVNASTGYLVSLSTLNINVRRSSTGPDNLEWQYSLNGFSTPGITIGSSFVFTTIPSTNNGVAQAPINLSGIPALQNIPSGTMVTFRLYAWGAVSSTGVLGIGRLAGNDLAIGGTVCALPARPADFIVSSSAVCQGQNNVAYTVPNDIAVTSYSWSYDGLNASFSSSINTVNVSFASNATSGNLKVIANNACGSSPERTVAVTVNTPPSAPAANSPQTFCSNENKKVSDLVVTGNNLQYYPSVTGLPYADPSAIALEDGETYYVTQTADGCTGSAAAITVNINTAQTFYADADNDGYGDASVTIAACIAQPGYVNVAGDCDDTNGAVHPGAAEACNGIDDDCDGNIDEGFVDADGDGIADCTDTDDDNDGDPDVTDCAPFDPAVNNLVLPLIQAPAPITANTSDDGTGNCTTIINLGTPATNNNCSVHTFKAYVAATEIDPVTYAFPAGITIVRWEVTDAMLRTASGNQVVTVTDNEKPSITCPADQTVPFDPGQLYATVNPGNPVVSDNCTATNEIVVVSTRSDNESLAAAYPMGVTTINRTATDAANNSETCRQTITVRKRNALVTYTGAMVNNKVCVQYSDIINLSALLTDNEGGTPSNISGRTVTFQLWFGAALLRSKPAITNAGGIAQDTFKVAQPAGDYVIKTVFAGDDYFTGSSDQDDCKIKEEDAEVQYSGNTYFSTLSATNYNYTLILSGAATDNNDGAATRGKISGTVTSPGKALMDFDLWGTSTPVNATATVNRPIGFIDPGDTTRGMATSNNFQGVISNSEAGAGGKIIEIYATVKPVAGGSYYTGASDKQLITIGVPGQDNITGGGYFHAANPKGIYADANTPKVNFGFTMKYNKSSKNLMGQANVIFRAAGGISYQVKSNAINSLTVTDIKQGTNVTGRRAVFNTKANFNKIEVLTDGTVIVTSLGGNLNLSVEAIEMLDGTKDKFSVTLTDPGGGLLYASNWNSSLPGSVVQDIANGKIYVRGNATSVPVTRVAPVNSMPAGITHHAHPVDIKRKGFAVDRQLTLTEMPNPSADKFTLLLSGGTGEGVALRVTGASGKVIEERNNVSGSIIQFGNNYRPGVYIAEITQGNARKIARLIKL